MSGTTSKRVSVSAAAGCAVTAALLLSGCGSTKADTTVATGITGAQSTKPSPPASASPSPSGSTPPAAVLPAGFTIVVDGGATGNPEKDAVLAANLSFYRAEYQAIGKQDPNDSLYRLWTGRYNAEFDAQSSTETYINSIVGQGLTVSGTLRIYNEDVTSIVGSKAELNWCEDQTKAFAKVVKTGAVEYNAPSRKSYFYYQSIMIRNGEGRWITTAIQSIQGDSRCS